ncbi:MAG: aquaporin [Saprospiraceae bacterium]|nr:aquaporin [Saprospiraceae bacterium]
MQKYLAELIGAFFLTLTFVLTTTHTELTIIAPAATGLIFMAMIYAGGHISGGQYNPVLTLAALLRGRLSTNDAISYMLAQTIGAVAAAAIGVYLHGSSGEAVIGLHGNNDPIAALLAEFLGAFALAYVFLNVRTTQSNAEFGFYGQAIGWCTVACGYALGSVSGGVFNPSMGIGASFAGMYSFSDLWIYVLGALAGGGAAATVFTVVYGRGE